MRRFELTSDTSNKFWPAAVVGSGLEVSWGRIGTAGQRQIKELTSAARAQADLDKLIAEKTKKGYCEVAPAPDADAAPPAPTAAPAEPAPTAEPAPPAAPAAPDASAAVCDERLVVLPPSDSLPTAEEALAALAADGTRCAYRHRDSPAKRALLESYWAGKAPAQPSLDLDAALLEHDHQTPWDWRRPTLRYLFLTRGLAYTVRATAHALPGLARCMSYSMQEQPLGTRAMRLNSRRT